MKKQKQSYIFPEIRIVTVRTHSIVCASEKTGDTSTINNLRYVEW